MIRANLHRLIDSIVSVIILLILLFFGNSVVSIFGGTLSLLIFLPILYYITYVQQTLQLIVSLFNIILLLLLGINFLNYCDLLELYTKMTIVISYSLLTFLTQFCFCFMLITQLKEYILNDNCIKAKEHFKFNVFCSSFNPVLYIIMMCIIFYQFKHFPAVTDNIIKMIPASFSLIPIFLIRLNQNLMRKKNAEPLNYILKKNDFKIPETSNLKKLYLYLIGIIFLLGNGIELGRGEWMLWIETYLVVIILPIVFWSVYKHRSIKNQSFDEQLCCKIESVINPKIFIKKFIITTIELFFVVFFTMALLFVIK